MNKQSKIELLPCPFCSGSARLAFGEHDFNGAEVFCNECCASGGHHANDALGESASAAWNARSLPVGVPDREWIMHMLADRWPDDGDMVEVEFSRNWLDEVLAAPTVKAEQVRYSDCMCGGGEFHGHTAECQYEHFLAYSSLQEDPMTRYAYIKGLGGDCEKPALSLPAAGSAGLADAIEIARRNLSNAIEDVEDGKTVAALPALREAAHFLAQAALSAQQSAPVADYEESLADQCRLVRELDVLLNGEDGAAPQASLCDIVGQVSSIVRDEGLPLLAAFSASKYAPERVSVPEGWRIVEKPTCFVLLDGNQVVATLAGPEAEKNAVIIAALLAGHGRGEA